MKKGPKYKFGDVNIDSSIQGVDTAALTKGLKTQSGHTFDFDRRSRNRREDLTIELSRLGYVFAQVRPRGDRDYATNTINLTYVIDEGQRVYIERIDIHGNTQDARLRDPARVRRRRRAMPINRVLIDKAERKLRDLGYFKDVTITTEPGSAPDKVVVVVNVEDKSTGSFGIAAGVETSGGSTGLVAEVVDGRDELPRSRPDSCISRSAAASTSRRSTRRSPIPISSATTCRSR